LLKGIYVLEAAPEGDGPEAQLLASGVGVPWAKHARELLAEDWGVRDTVWSVTSWTELRKEAKEVKKHNHLNQESPRTPWISQRLEGVEGPFVASSDYDFMVPDMIREWIPGRYGVLGADGWGFSDTRPAARRHLKIDAHSMVVKALQLLAKEGTVDPAVVRQAIDEYDLTNVNAGESGSFGGESCSPRRAARRLRRTARRPCSPVIGPSPRASGPSPRPLWRFPCSRPSVPDKGRRSPASCPRGASCRAPMRRSRRSRPRPASTCSATAPNPMPRPSATPPWPSRCWWRRASSPPPRSTRRTASPPPTPSPGTAWASSPPPRSRV